MAAKNATKPKAGRAPAIESIINDETRVFTDAPLVVAQGDLYFIEIGKLPQSAKLRDDHQLAEGNTQGSRHVVAIGQVYDADPREVARMIKSATGKTVETQYLGPVFTSNAGQAYVKHPEHGDHDFQCETVRAVVFQRSLDAEERAQRVLD